jgi:hypothetical protein
MKKVVWNVNKILFVKRAQELISFSFTFVGHNSMAEKIALTLPYPMFLERERVVVWLCFGGPWIFCSLGVG